MSDFERGSIVVHAREVLGLPFIHCGRNEYGLDCLGLLLRVADRMGYRMRDTPKKPYSTVVTDLFGKYLDLQMDRVDAEDMLPGDWAFMTVNNAHGTHIACLTDRETRVHACAQAMKVVEIPYDDVARSCVLHGYRFKELS